LVFRVDGLSTKALCVFVSSENGPRFECYDLPAAVVCVCVCVCLNPLPITTEEVLFLSALVQRGMCVCVM